MLAKARSRTYSFFFTNLRASEFIQNRRPVGSGPSSNTCPRWPSQREQSTSSRTIPYARSSLSQIESFVIGWKKLGQPVPDWNLESEENRARSQPVQW